LPKINELRSCSTSLVQDLYSMHHHQHPCFRCKKQHESLPPRVRLSFHACTIAISCCRNDNKISFACTPCNLRCGKHTQVKTKELAKGFTTLSKVFHNTLYPPAHCHSSRVTRCFTTHHQFCSSPESWFPRTKYPHRDQIQDQRTSTCETCCQLLTHNPLGQRMWVYGIDNGLVKKVTQPQHTHLSPNPCRGERERTHCGP
jgi:hypothetical protein